jgi:iron complex outermembrane receptor protein
VLYEKGKHKFNFDAGYKNAADKFQLRKTLPANTNRSEILQAIGIHSVQINPATSLASGVQFIRRTVRSNNRGNHSINAAGAFVVLHQKVNEHFQINPSLRVDYNEIAGWELIPQLNLAWKQDKFNFRGSAGRSTREADFTERFNNYEPPLVASGNRIGNPGLTAESSFGYEAGADFFIHKQLKISGTWFQRFHNELIDYVLTPYSQMPRQVNLVPGGSYSLAKNISKVNTRGLEADLQYNQTFSAKQSLQVMMGAIWLKSTSSDTVPSLYVSNHARFLYNFSIRYQYRFLSFSFNGLYKERRPQTGNAAFVQLSKSYFLTNMMVEGRFLNNQLGLFVQADNLFNQSYADILGTTMPGRWMMGGIKVTL